MFIIVIPNPVAAKLSWFRPNQDGKIFYCVPQENTLPYHVSVFTQMFTPMKCKDWSSGTFPLCLAVDSSRIKAVFSFLEGVIQCLPKNILSAVSQANWSPSNAYSNHYAVNRGSCGFSGTWQNDPAWLFTAKTPRLSKINVIYGATA